MIEIGLNNITKNFGFKNILDGVSFEVMTGDRAAIVGRNGSGKTTIFNILTQSETTDFGEINVRNGAVIGHLDQISQLREPDTTVKDVLMESFLEILSLEKKLTELEEKMSLESDVNVLDKVMKEYSRVQNRFIANDGYAMTEKLNKIVEGFNLTEILNREYNVLSGGQKTVVRLAATILKEPDILLLDEPTNHLDIKTLEWFEEFISKYPKTVIFISHDRYFLDKAATKIIALESGKATVFNGNYTFSLKERERLLMLEFENYKNQQKKLTAMKAAAKRYREWAAKGDNESLYKKAKELEKRIEKMEVIKRPQIEKSKIPIHFDGDRSGHDVLVIRNFSLTLGTQELFRKADMDIYYKEKVCLLGDNGSGKTSLVHVLLGKNQMFDGKVSTNPSAVSGYIPQEIRFADEKASVLTTFRNECICQEGEARNILAKYFFFGDDVFKRVGVLSGGEKVILKLAMLVQNKVNFLILDEPTNHIDIETREILEEALLSFRGTLLFISHDRYFINKIATKVVGIKEKSFLSVMGNFSDFSAVSVR